MTEKPLERLNYYNGQRLEAADFKTEQDYHMRTRRWLNKSLYSAGIARGLEVQRIPKVEPPVPDDALTIVVSAGLALDYEGREIILLDDVLLKVCASNGSSNNLSNGNYLVVEYNEETIAYESGSCAVRSKESNTSKSSSNWGGPARIQSQVKFSWVRFVPPPGTNQIVLAWVELDANCSNIVLIETGIRFYIGRASEALVKQYVLEGERVIANVRSMAQAETYISTKAKVYFHIRGRKPNSITLYLKASEFPKIHYSEMGYHEHDLDLSINNVIIPPHQHDLPAIKTTGGEHTHQVTSIVADCDDAVWNFEAPLGPLSVINLARAVTQNRALTLSPTVIEGGSPALFSQKAYNLKDGPVEMKIELDNNAAGGSHEHTIPVSVTDIYPKTGPGISVPIQVGQKVSHGAGVEDDKSKQYLARSGRRPLTYFDNLKIKIDGHDKTVEIMDLIDSIVGDQSWGRKIGNGSTTHPLVDETKEAVPIRLDHLLSPSFEEGQHVIEFSLPPNSEANGGKIHYNLYIE